MSKKPINNLIVVSDLHCGCQLGLCPPTVSLDAGGYYQAAPLQRKMWRWWQHFWGIWVPRVTRGEPFSVCVNGDALDGRHHRAVTQISQNLADQQRIAHEVLAPVRDLCDGRLYMVRGTEAHVGESGENEEDLAVLLGAIPDGSGRHSRFELWIKVGNGLCHIMHHIGTSTRTAYQSSGPMGELTEEFVEAAKARQAPPDVVVRSHRHRHIEIRIPTENVYGIVFTTPGWQLKTPFTFKTGHRVSLPEIGGSLIRQGDEELYTRHKVWLLKRGRAETPEVEG